ncbi:hypothetical protein B1C81_40060, partial [Streptomyces sp. HG99]
MSYDVLRCQSMGIPKRLASYMTSSVLVPYWVWVHQVRRRQRRLSLPECSVYGVAMSLVDREQR